MGERVYPEDMRPSRSRLRAQKLCTYAPFVVTWKRGGGGRGVAGCPGRLWGTRHDQEEGCQTGYGLGRDREEVQVEAFKGALKSTEERTHVTAHAW